MTIEVVHAETEALIRERMAIGDFADAEEVILDALRTAPSPVLRSVPKTGRELLNVFDEARRILNGHELNFSREYPENPNREVDFS